MLQTRERNAEPIPGYRLIEPLGRGGFGEVWKCEAPGGLFKAIKFVAGDPIGLSGDPAPAAEELKAIQHIKSLRHPFLLSMERVELIDGELVIVMELADRSLKDVLTECQGAGAPGIPRAELLGYLREAADVLDVMNLRHGLQHLDIKPANLFLVSNHIKVADFGLVRRLGERNGQEDASVSAGNLTAVYASPELYRNAISSSCDQYSLAIVFQELLTGTRPFNGSNLRQLAMQHCAAEPDMQVLPEADRAVVGRALSKDPEQRFPTCMAFVQALEANQKGEPHSGLLVENGNRDTSAETTTAKKTHFMMPLVRGASGRRAGTAQERGPAQARFFPDYRFHNCLGQTPFGEAWEARTAEGQRRLIKILYRVTGDDAAREQEAIGRLQSLCHPALPEIRFVSGGPGCLLVDTVLLEISLRDRFQECRSRGERGIPRRLLLSWLRPAAQALDELWRRHGLQHLGLHSRNLLLDGDVLRIADFGFLPLLWHPTGQLQGQLQARYAAPELLDNQIGPACDSYSLAVIFQEMLSGTTPWRGRRSGLPNLEPLTNGDRAVLARALDLDPAQRFGTCMELVNALEGRPTTEVELALEAKGSPGASAIVAELIVESKGALPEAMPDKWAADAADAGVIQSSFTARLSPRNARDSFETFRRQWNARVVRESDNELAFEIALPGRFWQRWLGGAPGLLVEVHWAAPQPAAAPVHEVSVRVRSADKKNKPDDALVKEIAPLVLDSLRARLEAYPERRMQERVPWTHAVRASFLAADGQVGETIEGKGKDLSLSGMGLYLPRVPAGSQVTLELTTPKRTEPVVLSGQCVRVQRRGDGWFEVGVLF